MSSDQKNQNEAVLTEHLQDQFVAWFVGVMAVVYLIEHIHKTRQTKPSDRT